MKKCIFQFCYKCSLKTISLVYEVQHKYIQINTKTGMDLQYSSGNKEKKNSDLITALTFHNFGIFIVLFGQKHFSIVSKMCTI